MTHRTVFFVTNCAVDTATGGFADALDPDRPDILRAGRITCDASADPARDGVLAGAPKLLRPDDPDAGVADLCDAWLVKAEAEGREPILIVHGYDHRFDDAIIRAADVCSWYEREPGAPRLLPLAFVWPSVGGLLPSRYRAVRKRAEHAGAALWRLFGALARAKAVSRQSKPMRPHYLAQSMGVLVTRFAMQRALRPGSLSFPGDGPKVALPHRILGQAFLMAADESTRVFNDEPGHPVSDPDIPDGALRPFAQHVATSVSVAVFPPDAVTKLVGPFASPGKRISVHGPDRPQDLPDNVAVVDFAYAAANHPGPIGNEMTWNWHGHQYYRNQPRVRQDVVAAIRANGPPQQVPGRRRGQVRPYAFKERTDRYYAV